MKTNTYPTTAAVAQWDTENVAYAHAYDAYKASIDAYAAAVAARTAYAQAAAAYVAACRRS